MKTRIIFACVILTSICGCVNKYGQLRPPDPLGWAFFDLVNKPPAYGVGTEYVVTSPMPAMRYERRSSAPPDASMAWVDGYWGWDGRQWQWVPGHWAQPPRQGLRWTPPQYYSRNGQWYWRSGTWH